MLERVILMMLAAVLVPMVMAGMIQQIGESKPEAGSHPRYTENSKIIIIPCQKFGIAAPTREVTVAMLSKMEYWRTAAIIPHITPISVAIQTLSAASSSVVGKRDRISSMTGRLVE